MATYLEVEAIQPRIVRQVQTIIDLARAEGFTTLVDAITVQVVHNDVGVESELWEACVVEMSRAFSEKPRARFEDYEECFELEAFKERVVSAMAGRIDEILDEDACEDELDLQVRSKDEEMEDEDDHKVEELSGALYPNIDCGEESSEEEAFETMKVA